MTRNDRNKLAYALAGAGVGMMMSFTVGLVTTSNEVDAGYVTQFPTWGTDSPEDFGPEKSKRLKEHCNIYVNNTGQWVCWPKSSRTCFTKDDDVFRLAEGQEVPKPCKEPASDAD